MCVYAYPVRRIKLGALMPYLVVQRIATLCISTHIRLKQKYYESEEAVALQSSYVEIVCPDHYRDHTSPLSPSTPLAPSPPLSNHTTNKFPIFSPWLLK